MSNLEIISEIVEKVEKKNRIAIKDGFGNINIIKYKMLNNRVHISVVVNLIQSRHGDKCDEETILLINIDTLKQIINEMEQIEKIR